MYVNGEYLDESELTDFLNTQDMTAIDAIASGDTVNTAGMRNNSKPGTPPIHTTNTPQLLVPSQPGRDIVGQPELPDRLQALKDKGIDALAAYTLRLEEANERKDYIIRTTEKLIANPKMSSAQKSILFTVTNNFTDEVRSGKPFHAPIAKIADLSGIDRKTVQRAQSQLVEAGALSQREIKREEVTDELTGETKIVTDITLQFAPCFYQANTKDTPSAKKDAENTKLGARRKVDAKVEEALKAICPHCHNECSGIGIIPFCTHCEMPINQGEIIPLEVASKEGAAAESPATGQQLSPREPETAQQTEGIAAVGKDVASNSGGALPQPVVSVLLIADTTTTIEDVQAHSTTHEQSVPPNDESTQFSQELDTVIALISPTQTFIVNQSNGEKQKISRDEFATYLKNIASGSNQKLVQWARGDALNRLRKMARISVAS